MPDIRQLHHFVTVAREMHFSRAAEALHIAQPSLSQSIRQIEKDLGVELFHRTSRNVKLTAAGKVFYEEAQHTLDQMAHACRAAQQAARGEHGALAIGFVTTAIMGGLQQRIACFREHFPKVELELRELLVDTMLDQLHLGALDLICTDSYVMDARLRSRKLASPPWVIAVPVTHRLAKKHAVHLEEFAEDPFIFPTHHSPHTLHDTMLHACKKAGFVPNRRYFADSVATAVSMVAAQLGIAIVYELPGFRPPGVVYKAFSPSVISVSMRLSWRRGELTPAAAHFLRLGSAEGIFPNTRT
jgi:DNA-binding transcriptional LysR family regulator